MTIAIRANAPKAMRAKVCSYGSRKLLATFMKKKENPQMVESRSQSVNQLFGGEATEVTSQS
jgi:hypothetical protein